MPEAKFKDKKDKGPWKWSKDEVGYKQDDLLLMEWATKKVISIGVGDDENNIIPGV